MQTSVLHSVHTQQVWRASRCTHRNRVAMSLLTIRPLNAKVTVFELSGKSHERSHGDHAESNAVMLSNVTWPLPLIFSSLVLHHNPISRLQAVDCSCSLSFVPFTRLYGGGCCLTVTCAFTIFSQFICTIVPFFLSIACHSVGGKHSVFMSLPMYLPSALKAVLTQCVPLSQPVFFAVFPPPGNYLSYQSLGRSAHVDLGGRTSFKLHFNKHQTIFPALSLNEINLDQRWSQVHKMMDVRWEASSNIVWSTH